MWNSRPVRVLTMRSMGRLNQFQSHSNSSTTRASIATASAVRSGWRDSVAWREREAGGVGMGPNVAVAASIPGENRLHATGLRSG